MATQNIKRNPDTGEVAVYGEWDEGDGKIRKGWRTYAADTDAARDLLHYASATQRSEAQKVTGRQQLIKENRPFMRGFEAGTREVSEGAKEIGEGLTGGGMSLLGGSLRAANAPGVAAGSAVGTSVHNLLTGIPGLGGVEGAIPAAGAAVADAATQMVTGPKLWRAGVGMLKSGVKGIGELLSPSTMREAASEAVAKRLGYPTSSSERVFTPAQSDALFGAARGVQDNVPLDPIKSIIRDVNTRVGGAKASGPGIISTPNPRVANRTKNLLEKYGSSSETTYDDLIMETQVLKNEARRLLRIDPNAAKEMNDLTASIIDKMDEVSPVLKEANKRYLRELFDKDITQSMRTGNPGVSIREIFESDAKNVRRVFDKKAVDDIYFYADRASDVASSVPSGLARQFFSAISEPFSQMLMSDTGRKLLRNSMTPTGEFTVQSLNAATQLWRAYQAHAGGQS